MAQSTIATKNNSDLLLLVLQPPLQQGQNKTDMAGTTSTALHVQLQQKRFQEETGLPKKVGNVSETPTPTTCLKSTAVHLQFVWQYAPHLYCRTFLASELRRKGNPAVRLPFVLQYASYLYGSTPPICTAVRPPFVRQYFWRNTGGWGHRNVSEKGQKTQWKWLMACNRKENQDETTIHQSKFCGGGADNFNCNSCAT